MATKSSSHYVPIRSASLQVGARQDPSGRERNTIEVYKAASDPAKPDSPIQTFTMYTDPRASNSYISIPPRSHNAHYTEGQVGGQGFRDDLRHHEDQDKNGNMKDGGNVGEPVSRPQALKETQTTSPASNMVTPSWPAHDTREATSYYSNYGSWNEDMNDHVYHDVYRDDDEEGD